MEKLGVGLIGFGGIGHTHFRLVREEPGLELRALCDIDRGKLDEAGGYGVERLYTDYREMIDDGGIDLVIVATPPKYHVEQALYALDKGLYVLLEKPIALSLEEARKLYERARGSNKVMVTFSLRYHGFYEKIKNVIDSVLGEPLYVWHYALGEYPDRPWIKDRGMSGGMLNENGVHIIYLHRWWIGEIRRVYARSWRLVEDSTIEDNLVLLMDHGGPQSILIQSWSGGHHVRRWGVVCEKGRITCDGYLRGSYKISLSSGEVLEEGSIGFSVLEMYRRQLKHFIECIRNGWKPYTDIEEGYRVQEVVEAAYKSSEKGCHIELPL